MISTQPLTIVHVQTRFLRGGAEENTWGSCVHQVKSGHRVHLLCGADSDFDHYRSLGSGVQIHAVPSLVRSISPGADYRAFLGLAETFRRLRPDIVHTHTSKAGIVGRLAARRAGVPTIIQGVHMLPFSNVGLLEKCVYVAAEHVVARSTDLFVHVSHGTRDAYGLARVGRRVPHVVVRSGMAIEAFRRGDWPDDWRTILGVRESDPKPTTILMLASLEARKRHIDFLEGFAALISPEDNIRLLLAGEGPDALRIEKRIAELGLNNHVRMLGHRSDPEKLVAMSDIGVLASLREGLPRVVVQYLAGGKPAVVSPLRGIEEIVQTGSNGIVASGKSAFIVALEAIRLARDAPRLASLSQGARQARVDEWSHASMFAQLDDAYAAARARLPAAPGRTISFEPHGQSKVASST